MFSPGRSNKNKKIYTAAVAAMFTVLFAVNLAFAAGSALWLPLTSGLIVADSEAASSDSDQVYSEIIKTSDNNYIAWWLQDNNRIIKVQKFNSAGVAQWTPSSGITIYDGNTTTPQASATGGRYGRVVGVPDTSGGIIIVWNDGRNTTWANHDIFGVRLTSAGTFDGNWGSVNGKLLLESGSTGGDHVYDAIPDGSDGVLFAYTRLSTPLAPYNGYPYVQHINSLGNTQTGWTDNLGLAIGSSPLPLQSSTVNVSSFHIIANGSFTEYFVAFGDKANNVKVAKITEGNPPVLTAPVTAIPSGSTDYSENRLLWDGSTGVYLAAANYLQHLNGSLSLLYGAAGVTFDTTGSQTKLTADTSATPYLPIITWTYPGASDYIKAQRFTSAGTADAGWNGGSALTVSNSSADASWPAAISDGANGIYITWQDARNGNIDLYAQHVDSTGTAQFGGNDLQLTALPADDFQRSERVPFNSVPEIYDMVSEDQMQTTANGFINVWQNTTLLANISSFYQVTDASGGGSVLFSPDGESVAPLTSVPVDQTLQNIIKATDNTYIIAWMDAVSGGNYAIYAQKINSSGVKLWANEGELIISDIGSTLSANKIEIVADDAGGAILAWEDNRGSTQDLYIQKINSDGVPQWNPDGIFIQTMGTDPQLLTDGNGGAYLIFTDESGADRNIALTQVLSDGNLDPGFDPYLILGTGDDEFDPHIVYADDNSLIASYGSGGGGSTEIHVAKGDLDGNGIWISPTVLTGVTVDIGNHQLVGDGNGGAYIAYEYQNGADYNIYLQHIDSAGSELPDLGITICDASGRQKDPQMVSDNLGVPSGVIISWDDLRDSKLKVYAQRVDGATLTPQWTVNGEAISDPSNTNAYIDNNIISNGGYGAIISFIDFDIEGNNSDDIYAQHLDSSGNALWTTYGEPVETNITGGYKDSAIAMAGDGNGGAVITWQREPGIPNYDIHAQYIQDDIGGLCAEAGSQTSGEIQQKFCGQQLISEYVLTFLEIPDSFNFGTLTTGINQDVCNNTSTLAAPVNICSNNASPDPPGMDDVLTVRDERNSGGFIVQLSVQGTFTDGTNTIPLDNLYIVSTIDESDPNKANGINYGSPFQGDKNVLNAVYVDESVEDISDPETYTSTSTWPAQTAPHTNLIVTQFGGNPLDLMNGTLAATEGRVGNMSMFTNFNLTIDPTQEPGDYTVILTYDLMDSTT